MANKKISELSAAGTLTGAELIEAVQNGSNVKMTATNIANLAEHFRGAYNASGGTYPASGGSGASGVIKAGDEWYVSIGGELTTPAGTVTVEVGALLKALVNSPGQTAASWKVIQ